MRINEVTLKNQEQQIEYWHALCRNFLWIASDFLRLQLFNSFFSCLIYVGGGFFIRKGNHNERYSSLNIF